MLQLHHEYKQHWWYNCKISALLLNKEESEAGKIILLNHWSNRNKLKTQLNNSTILDLFLSVSNICSIMKALQLFFETALHETVMTGTISIFNLYVKVQLKSFKSYTTE